MKPTQPSQRPRGWLGAASAALITGGALLVSCGGGGTSLHESSGSSSTSSATGTSGGDTSSNSSNNNSNASAWTWRLPAFFPVPKVPEDNPMSAAKVELGRFLFYDIRLSGNGTQSCGSCHLQDKAFTDGKAVATGSTGEATPRSSQHLGNVGYAATLTWANPSLVTLERQMETPLFGEGPVEMGINDKNKAAVLQRLRDDTAYPAKFAAAFSGQADPIHWGNVIKAIAAFERTLISGDSKYDQYLAGKAKLSENETRGMNLFFGEKAECFHCHGSFNFNDQVVHAAGRVVETPFHNTGLYNLNGKGAYPEHNRGVFELTAQADDMGKFRAPSLRNVEVTAPYMHDGSMASLEEVLRTYAAGGRWLTTGALAGDGRANPYKSDLIARIDLSAQEQADIIAFLKTLTDHTFLTDTRHADPFVKR